MITRICLLCILFLTFVYSSYAQSASSTRPPKRNVAKIERGTASYYAKKFQGRKTASGALYDYRKMTAAHNHLPFGTWVRVTNIRNGKKVVVKVNDRLHHKNKRLIDLSYAAAAKLGYLSGGLTKVKVEVLGMKKPK